MINMTVNTRGQYKSVRGMSGQIYKVRMSEKEMNARRILGLIFGIVVVVPAWVIAMALAAGLI